MDRRQLFRVSRGVLVVGCVGLAAHARADQPASDVTSWVPTAGGAYAWNNNANWTGSFPNSAGATAKLSLDIVNDQTINLNQNVTLDRMDIGDTVTTGRAFNIAGGPGSNTLTFQSALPGGVTSINSDTVAVSGTALNITGNVKLGGTSSMNLNLNGANNYGAKFATLDLNGNNLALKTGNNMITFNPGTVTGNGNIIVNAGGITSPDSSTSGGMVLTQNMPGFTGSIKVNNGRVSLVNGKLPNAATLEVTGAFTPNDRYPKGGRLEIGDAGTVFTSLPDRLPHDGAIVINGGGYFTYWGAGLHSSLAGQHVEEQVRQIRFNPGMSEIRMLNGNNVSATTTLLATDPTHALVREKGATVMIGGDDMRSAGHLYQNAMGVAEFLKFNSGVASQMIGGGGGPGSNNISIIPWITVGTLYHPSQGGLATYDPINGVRCLLLSEYYTGTVLGAPPDVNVRDSSINLGANKTQTINSWRTGSWTNTDIGPGSALTVTSGAIMFAGGGVGSNGSIGNGNPANAGTLNFGAAEGIIWSDWGNAGANTIGSRIAGSGGLTKAGTNLLILKGANTYTGKTTVGAGILQVGDGALTTSRLGKGDVQVTPGATLRIRRNVANGIDDGAAVYLDSSGDVWFSTMSLDAGINERVGALRLGGVAMPAGTYGSSASNAMFKRDDYFTGAGMLTVVPESASAATLLGAGFLFASRRWRTSTAIPAAIGHYGFPSDSPRKGAK